MVPVQRTCFLPYYFHGYKFNLSLCLRKYAKIPVQREILSSLSAMLFMIVKTVMIETNIHLKQVIKLWFFHGVDFYAFFIEYAESVVK